MENLSTVWKWGVIIIGVVSLLGCGWLLEWTKGVGDDAEHAGDSEDTGHVWDETIHE